MVSKATRLVVMLNDADVCPSATVTVAGTMAKMLELLSEMIRPPGGAGDVNVTVAVTGDPPTIEPTLS